MKLCENGHPIYNENNEIFPLCRCVIHCHNCSNSIVLDVVNAVYLGDKTDSQGTWHIYYLYPQFNCKNCGTLFSTYAVFCQPQKESELNYELYKKASNPAAEGRVQ